VRRSLGGDVRRSLGGVDRSCDEWVDMAVTKVAQKRVWQSGTRYLFDVHNFRDSGSSTRRSRDDLFHFGSTGVLVVIEGNRGNTVVKNGNEGLLTAPASPSSPLNKIIQTKRTLQEYNSIDSRIVHTMKESGG